MTTKTELIGSEEDFAQVGEVALANLPKKENVTDEQEKDENAQCATTDSLARKLSRIMGKIGRVAKRGRNTFHGYNYATEADLADTVRPFLAAEGIIMVPSVKSAVRAAKGDSGVFLTDVEVLWTLTDGYTGQTLVFSMPGCGEDKGDKGLYKAITGSEKYALKNLFLIPTGDDPEKDEPQNVPIDRSKLPIRPPIRPKPPMLPVPGSHGNQEEALVSADPQTEALPDAWKPFAKPASDGHEFSGVLENVKQRSDTKEPDNKIWTSGDVNGRYIFTFDKLLGAEMLRFKDCDCTVTVKPSKKPNNYQLVSIK